MNKLWLIVVASLMLPALAVSAAPTQRAPLGSDQALGKLIAGNKRFAAAENSASKPLAKRRAELVNGQQPFAVVVGCSDSRVPPEIIFDQNLGDLFVIRTAGDLLDDIGIGSVEYAVEQLGTHLIVILAHENCGAVMAAIVDKEVHGHIQDIVDQIRPAVGDVGLHRGDYSRQVAEQNALHVKHKLMEESSIVRDKVGAGDVRIVTAYYELSSGHVAFFESRSEMPQTPSSPKVPAASGEHINSKK